jgi:hypothetical protein
LLRLKFEFRADLEVEKSFSGNYCMTKLIPYSNARAIAFGWGTEHNTFLGNEQYWFSEIRRDGVSQCILPMELTDRFNHLVERENSGRGSFLQVKAFKLGEDVGLLLGSEIVFLYSSIHDNPKVIRIDNHFSTNYFPEHCGNASGNIVPVVLSASRDSGGDGRHASLLEIDKDSGRARWLHTQAEGYPRSTLLEEYLQFCTWELGGLRVSNTGITRDQPPLLYDCAWVDNHWHLYAAGFDSAHYNRYGISLAVLTRNFVDLSFLEALFQPKEESFGRICASLDRLVVTPHRKGGIHKGKQTIYLYSDGEEHSVTMPRGYANHLIEEYCAGYYWLLANRLGYSNNSVAVCSAE